jgi:biotin transport system substrate-specific component
MSILAFGERTLERSIPMTRRAQVAREVAVSLVGAMLIALGARLSFYLPPNPVPVTLSTLAVLTLALTLGRARALRAVSAYLAAGATGLPVFAAGGGLWYFAGPTGGYLAGYVLGAWVTGTLTDRRWTNRLGGSLVATLAGTLAIFVPGLLWLGTFVPTDRLLSVGFWPFVPGGAVKALMAVTLAGTLRRR